MVELIEPSMARTIELIEHTFNSHWEDMGEICELTPNYEHYKKLEELGLAYSLIALNEEELMGYVIFFITPHHHHSNTLWAYSDILYVTPEYRGGTVCKRLLSHAEEKLREKGVDVIIVGMKDKKRFDALLEKIGYNPYEGRFAQGMEK